MNIFIDTRPYKPNTFSGISEYTRLLVERFTADYPEHRYTFFANGFKKQADIPFFRSAGNRTAINFRIPNRIFDPLNLFLRMPKIDALFPSDVFWSPNINILSFRNPEKRVLTVHDVSFLHPEFFSVKQRLWHWRQGYRYQIETAGRLIAPSDFTKETLMDAFKVPEEKITRIYPGIDPVYKDHIETEEMLRAFKKEHALPDRFLLYSGTIEPRKNIIAVVRAFNALRQAPRNKDLFLILAGSRGWSYDTIFKEVECSPYRRNIIVWGKAKHEVMRCLYHLATVFVYPSFFEGVGFPPLEAQACGTPVVASNRTSLPEILGTSALLADPWKVHELIEAIEAFVDNPALRETFRKRGKNNSTRFDWRTSAAEHMNLFTFVAQRD